jgi:hypothetical protein
MERDDLIKIPRGEYQRPQFIRPDCVCLNGACQFEIDADDAERHLYLLSQVEVRLGASAAGATKVRRD